MNKYEEALERAKKVLLDCTQEERKVIEYTFPELAESEDEKIREELTEFFKKASGGFLDSTIHCKTFGKWLAWLEKQVEQKPVTQHSTEWSVSDFRTWQYIVSDVLTKKDGIGQYLDSGECKKIAKYMQEEWSKKLNIEQKHTELLKGEDYGIDRLYHAIDILERTLGKVSGYQSDDGILEHKCAISAVKELSKQKPTWSEEDETTRNNISHIIRQYDKISKRNNQPCWYVGDCLLWMQNIKERVQPQPKQEWSEEDEKMYNVVHDLAWESYKTSRRLDIPTFGIINDWLKSLKPQNHWKPSEEQIRAFEWAYKSSKIEEGSQYDIDCKDLLEQLKAL